MPAESSDRPKLIVFDLDYTLWPFYVDTHVTKPFRLDKGQILDRCKRKVACFPEVPAVLERLCSEGIDMAIASRTGEIEGANQLIQLFGWNKFFKYKEIYPGSKVTHFIRFCKQSGYKMEDMLFFDDEQRNIVELSEKGVTCVYVDNGVSMKVLDKGLEKFAKFATADSDKKR